MSLFPIQDGYYDKNGRWQSTKFCFVSCGDRCTCRAPGGVYQLKGEALEKHLENVKERQRRAEEFKRQRDGFTVNGC